MDATIGARRPGLLPNLWQRQLPRYPTTARRYMYLGIVVAATVTLYYELYINGAVSPSILAGYNISFTYYVIILIAANALGAFGALFAGLADRWGRANLLVVGLLATALFALVGVPNVHSGFAYGVILTLITIVEGMALVATPALMRDFSPQVGRATALGFWTLGPVIGSLVVTEVSSHTLSHFSDWQAQYKLAGIVGLVVWVITFLVLRELSPQLRDQLMVELDDRPIIEAKAKSIDVKRAVENQWRRVLKPAVIGGALGVSLFLILYYTAVAFMVIYITTVFRTGFTQDQANSILNWWWAVEAGTLIAVGLLSDRLLVRKPFAVVGAVGTAVMTLILIHVTGQADTSYNGLVLVVSLLGFFGGLAFTPWMAAFTETVEKISPALSATGLAVWGWILRATVSVIFLLVIFVVPAVTPLANFGPAVAADLKDPRVAAVVQYGPTLQQDLRDPRVASAVAVQQDLQDPKVAAAVPVIQAHPAVFAQLAQYPANAIPPEVLAGAIAALGGGAQALAQLQTVGAATSDPVSGPRLLFVVQNGVQALAALSDPIVGPKLVFVAAHGPEVQAAQSDPAVRSKVAFVAAHGPEVQKAKADTAGQWQKWFWVCFAGQLLFVPLIFVLTGRWSPARARQDERQHELARQKEMEALGLTPA
ncbi:MAG: MFS transporter [Chloroflexi bacterium]|nr:MAG: MFS transporter [Chloroflexota bacterium]